MSSVYGTPDNDSLDLCVTSERSFASVAGAEQIVENLNAFHLWADFSPAELVATIEHKEAEGTHH
jgi:hypothetical protein